MLRVPNYQCAYLYDWLLTEKTNPESLTVVCEKQNKCKRITVTGMDNIPSQVVEKVHEDENRVVQVFAVDALYIVAAVSSELVAGP